ncbi:Pre-mRNA-splicing factor cwf19 [Collariella sp. IMI 366227]|nr:Pre-mRNA-splicing factor cwf19 [Collariella sp. IMI 366227]
MDSLYDFEKQLAAEKAEGERAAQEKEERREHPRNATRATDTDTAIATKIGTSANDDKQITRATKDIKDLKNSDPKKDLPLPDEEATPAGATPLARDSWMTAPSALDIDYIHRGTKRKSSSPEKEEPPRVLHTRELNRGLEDAGRQEEESQQSAVQEVAYKFGDEGSQWRMTKLKAVYTISEQTGRSIDDVAEERFGTLREFDDAREEKMELDRRRVYGEGYVGKEKPTGDLYTERMAKIRPDPSRSPSPQPEQGVVIEEMMQPAPPMDQSALNRMRAQLMKAKLRNAPDATKLEAEYNAAMAAFTTGAASNAAVVLDASHNRMLAGARGEVKAVTNKRGLERGLVEANDDMSIEDMVREERRTRNAPGGEGARLAERIAKDARFDNDLEYLDENAAKLARRVHKTDASLKNIAVTEYKKLNRILDTCPLCYHEDLPPPQNLPSPLYSPSQPAPSSLCPPPQN